MYDTSSIFKQLQLKLQLRTYQRLILEIYNKKRERGQKRFHIVAPPGSGKTIVGLQMIIETALPSLILSPNTAIQMQFHGGEDLLKD